MQLSQDWQRYGRKKCSTKENTIGHLAGFEANTF